MDHRAQNLLLEARPDWSNKNLVLHPQVIFERRGPQIRGDYEEMVQFGRREFELVLSKSLLGAFQRYRLFRSLPTWQFDSLSQSDAAMLLRFYEVIDIPQGRVKGRAVGWNN